MGVGGLGKVMVVDMGGERKAERRAIDAGHRGIGRAERLFPAKQR